MSVETTPVLPKDIKVGDHLCYRVSEMLKPTASFIRNDELVGEVKKIERSHGGGYLVTMGWGRTVRLCPDKERFLETPKPEPMMRHPGTALRVGGVCVE